MELVMLVNFKPKLINHVASLFRERYKGNQAVNLLRHSSVRCGQCHSYCSAV